MKVRIYVEGAADERALRPLLARAVPQGVGVKLVQMRGKSRVLDEAPTRAAIHLRDYPEDLTIALPDLYPRRPYDDTPNAHQSALELRALLTKRFEGEARRLRVPKRARDRFRVHCLKHDLEVLLLACPDLLRKRLGTDDKFEQHWPVAVEDQNEDKPPKYVVDELFRKYTKPKRGYDGVNDAAYILDKASIDDLVSKCPQCFAPLVEDLRRANE